MREVGGRFKRETTYIYLCLIPVEVWQKPSQYCKVTLLQLKINRKMYMMIAGGWKCGIAWQKCLRMEWNGASYRSENFQSSFAIA